MRRELYAQCFEELIRQTLLNSLERGLLLLRWERIRLHHLGFHIPLNLNSHANESKSGSGMSSDWLYMQQRPFMNRALHLVTGDTGPDILILLLVVVLVVMMMTMMTMLSTLLSMVILQASSESRTGQGRTGSPRETTWGETRATKIMNIMLMKREYYLWPGWLCSIEAWDRGAKHRKGNARYKVVS